MALFQTTHLSGLPLLTDVAVDASTGLPILENGLLRTVSGQQALRQWIDFALDPQSRRFAYAAYTPAYGNEWEQLAELSREEAEHRLPEMVRRTLGVNPYITAITDLSAALQEDRLCVALTLETVYGPMEYQGEAILY